MILFLFILNRILFLIVEKLLQKIKQNQLAHHVAYRFICYIKFLCTYYLWNQIYHIMRFWTLDEETFSYDGIILNITLTINEYEKLINAHLNLRNIMNFDFIKRFSCIEILYDDNWPIIDVCALSFYCLQRHIYLITVN